MENEFSRLKDLRQLAETGKTLTLEATPKERGDLARRAGIPALKRLSATLKAKKIQPGVFLVTGALKATVTLECRRTLKPFDQDIGEPIEEGFIEEAIVAEMNREAAAGFEDFEEFPGEEVDLGEVVAQDLMLAIDPFPILEGDFSEKIATSGVQIISQEDAKAKSSPFSKLKKLQKKA